ncbi:MAG: ACT domain-containing protein [Clostridia bacterium]|nr:ACT domain-containing protein [Clostridia bacterium]
MKAILTVIGRDRSGIIARTSTLLYKHEANIEDLTQTVLSGYFTMVMLIDLSAMTISFEELQAELNALGAEMGVEIRMQRREIFDAMHRL